jgi:hypothetical protein
MKPTVLLKKAQISKSELARLTRFSRPTIQRWLEQGVGPRRHTDAVFYRGILTALEQCLVDKELPLPLNLSSAERDRRIKAMVKERFDLEDIQYLIA